MNDCESRTSRSKTASAMRAIRWHHFDVGAAAHGGHRGASRRLGRDRREFHRKAAALAERAFDANSAIVLFQYLLAHWQPETGAAAPFARHKHGKDFIQIVWFDAAAV